MLKISCQECGAYVCNYQKDGHGALRRMYLDRISNSKVVINKNSLNCSKGHLLGTKMIYVKEKRLAFRLFVDSVIKKIIKNA